MFIEALVLAGDYVSRDNLNVVLDALIPPHILWLTRTTNSFWSDPADVSAETETLVIAFARETPPSPSSARYQTSLSRHKQCFVDKNQIIYFLDALILKSVFKVRKINNCQRGVTDISAKNKTTGHKATGCLHASVNTSPSWPRAHSQDV